MPELPEVETVKRGLETLVLGKTIESIEILWPRIIENDTSEFQTILHQQTIESISRRGKFLIFHLTNSDLISHLRMEGKYEFHAKTDEIKKHTHVIFQFSDQTQLRYLDVRKFGRMKVVEKGQALLQKNLASLGPEPTKEEFDLKVFTQQLKKKQKAIKPLLLDQKLVVGLGNIYVDEVLWQAKIHPLQLANTISKTKVIALHQAIIDTLNRAVQAGGTTIRSYVDATGHTGAFQQQLNVYAQTNQPCPRCGSIISKMKVAGRGTHYCPVCQKEV
ncbi:MAG: DNA-formamidopyrimidine glycosylase [Streptococcaceae bacterium]|jgi:formamidopyrimidine-DNA glycosylase|nr:DNA-formamidopyrimidine glycosylase [Streptococcaceae bacterium]